MSSDSDTTKSGETNRGVVTDQSEILADIPENKYFKIGEVAEIVGVKPYILRYWESEFDLLEPKKNKSRHRQYQKPDIELLLQIKHLLYEQMYTIAGARQRLAEIKEGGESDEMSQDEGESLFGDVLEGTEVEALEQEVGHLRARVKQLEEQISDAEETAQVASAALKEVQQAHAEAQEENKQLREELEEAASPEEVEREREELEAKIEELRQENETLRAERDAATTAKERSGEEDADAEGWSDDAHEAALQEAHRRQRELRNDLHRVNTHHKEVLKTIRGEVEAITELLQPLQSG